MPSVRSLILIAIGIFVLVLVIGLVGLLQTPDSNGLGRDSYGTRESGYRAIYETLEELGVPVERQLAPPEADPQCRTLVFLNPDPRLCGVEPAYLKNLKPWVEAGGRVVVASRADLLLDAMTNESADAPIELPTILESLGLPGVHFEPIAESWTDFRQQRESDELFSEELLENFRRERIPPKIVEVTASGLFADWQNSVQHLALPEENASYLVWGDTEPEGRLFYRTEEEEERAVAAVFSVGKGQIVVAEEGLFRNRMLPREDNAVAAAYLISPTGSRVIFDEFYHGLGVRGNPMYLLTRPGYLAVALGLLLVIGLLSWRKAILLGPPLADEPQTRRDIGEYISAMGQFFSQGRSSRRFLIRQIQAGVLRELNIAYGLPPESQEGDLVIGLMARNNPRRAERVREALQRADEMIRSNHRPTEQQTLDVMRRLTACL